MGLFGKKKKAAEPPRELPRAPSPPPPPSDPTPAFNKESAMAKLKKGAAKGTMIDALKKGVAGDGGGLFGVNKEFNAILLGGAESPFQHSFEVELDRRAYVSYLTEPKSFRMPEPGEPETDDEAAADIDYDPRRQDLDPRDLLLRQPHEPIPQSSLTKSITQALDGEGGGRNMAGWRRGEFCGEGECPCVVGTSPRKILIPDRPLFRAFGLLQIDLYSAYGSPCTSRRRGHFTLPISFGGVVLAPRSFCSVLSSHW